MTVKHKLGEFGFGLYKSLCGDSEEGPERNVVVAVEFVTDLIMFLALGSRHRTLEQLVSALGFRDSYHLQKHHLARHYAARGGGGDAKLGSPPTTSQRNVVEVRCGSSPLSKSFEHELASLFHAEIHSDEAKSDAISITATSDIAPDDPAVDPRSQASRRFFHSSSGARTCEFRSRVGRYNAFVAARLGVVAVELPYRAGRSIVVLVPRERTSLADVERRLTAPVLHKLLRKQIVSGRVRITMPRFSVGSRADLAAGLQALGARDIFAPAPTASIGKIAPSGGAHLADFRHAATLSFDDVAPADDDVVDDEAAAGDTFEVVVDRPFMFVVKDASSGHVMVLGRVAEL